MQPDRLDGVNTIARLEDKRVWVHQTAFDHSVLVPSRGVVQPWPVVDFDSLGPEHFDTIAAIKPEVVIIGSGKRHRFARPSWLQPLVTAGIGFESMDTAAACRTYNVLASEGRSVLAALILE